MTPSSWFLKVLGVSFAILLSGGGAEGLELVSIPEIIEPAVPAQPEKYLKVAVIQWAPESMTPVGVTPEQAEQVKQGNREALAQQIRAAAARGARWILAPELSFVGYPDIPELPPEEDEYRNRADIAPYVEAIPGPSTSYFGKLAQELGIWLNFGLAERDPVTDFFHNAVVVLNPAGEIVAKHRKVNLYELENQFFVPGAGPTFFQGPAGLTSVMICADVYDSSMIEATRAVRAGVVALSASWAQRGTGMSYFRRGARAMNTFVLASNHRYFPDSGVVNPDGSIQSHIRQTVGAAYGYLPLAVSGNDGR